jgi:hypothetical protein
MSRYQILSRLSHPLDTVVVCRKTSDIQGQNNRDLGNSTSLTYLFGLYIYTIHLRAHCFTCSDTRGRPLLPKIKGRKVDTY